MRTPTKRSTYLTLDATTAAPAQIRRYIEKTKAEWGISEPGVIELVATEFATNAIKASGVSVELEPCPDVSPARPAVSEPNILLSLGYEVAAGTLVLSVWDASAETPEAQSPTYDALGGRGLLLVSELTDSWGWYWPVAPVVNGEPWPEAAVPEDGLPDGQYGKVVWAAFELKPGD